jgi:choline dehydrogenase-like flavoprotein
VQRGSCGSGCNEGAKASTDVTHWPEIVRRGGLLITGARVRRIVVDERGLACGALWVDVDGNEHEQAANVVVCAANGVGTPRLLLASDGLANSSGLVGRNLMLHPLVSVVGLFDEPLDAWRAHAGALVHSLQFADSDPARGFARGATWSLGSSGGPLRAALAPDGRGRWGDEHHANVRARLGRSASWVIIAEDLPEHANCVELSSTLTDAAGLAGARIVYRLSDNTRRLMAWHVERATESLEAAGAYQTEIIRHGANGHLMGTARMGADPATSVVDASCRSHDVPNLLVTDGSVFVTAGSANPTTTIAAVALRAAERLVADWASIPKPSHRRTFATAKRSIATRRVRDVAPPVRLPTAAQRERLRVLADEWIPATDGMPAASEVGTVDAQLDRVLRARPDLAPLVRDALDDEGEPTGRALYTLRYVLCAAYYLAPEVRAALRYDPEFVATVRPLAFPEYVEEGLLDHLLEATS